MGKPLEKWHEKATKKSLIRKTILMIMIGMAILVIFVFVGDFASIQNSISRLSVFSVVLALFLALMSFFLRFAKWHYLLGVIGVKLPKKESLEIFFIGLSMSITPGKVGETLKCYLVQQKTGKPFWMTLPVIIVDRVADFVSMILLISFGIFLFDFGVVPFLLICSVLIVGLLVLKTDFFQGILKKWTKNFKRAEAIGQLVDNSKRLTKAVPFSFITILSIIVWTIEGLAMFVLVKQLQLDLSFIHTIFVFSLGAVAGGISMIPGGLGVAEGSMTGLLLYFNVGKSDAVSLAVLIRLITLWFGVLIGLTVYFVKRKKYSEG